MNGFLGCHKKIKVDLRKMKEYEGIFQVINVQQELIDANSKLASAPSRM